MRIGKDWTIWKDGQPCNHPGCRNHISHPCEGCGRQLARGQVINPFMLDTDRFFVKQQGEGK